MNEVKILFNKRGFTLVELLAVIIILGIILILAIPRVTNMIDKYKDKAYERQLDLIIKGAEIYSVLYEDEINWIGNQAFITLEDIQKKGLLPNTLKNPKGGEFNSKETIITLTRLANGSIDYAINIEGANGIEEPTPLRQPVEGEIAIASASDLAKIGKDANYPLDANYIQMANIDLSGYATGEGWEPIGDINNPFAGNFDGNGLYINNLTINRPNSNYQGLFGVINNEEYGFSNISNIALKNVNIKGNNRVGALIGSKEDQAFWTIFNCYSTGIVEGNNDVGGLIGFSFFNTEIKYCYSICEVIGQENVGGLTGSINESQTFGCYSISNVVGVSKVGGLVGSIASSLAINSYSTGSVEGDEYVGGLAGENIIGSIKFSYSTSKVEGNINIGGLVGNDNWNDLFFGSVESSYWDTETSGQLESYGGEGKTTAKMKQRTTFAGWDFNTIWGIEGGISYPYLLSNEQVPHPQ